VGTRRPSIVVVVSAIMRPTLD